jgi:hypothetical protein
MVGPAGTPGAQPKNPQTSGLGLVVPGPGDPGRRRVGGEVAGCPARWADGEGTRKVTGRRPGDGFRWAPEVLGATRRGLRSLGYRWSPGCGVVGYKRRGGGGLKGHAWQAAKKGLDF